MYAPRIVILFAGRFPSEKAAGLFVDLNARSLCAVGTSVTVLAPRRFGRMNRGAVPYEVVYLPTIDLSRVPFFGRVANYLTVAVFSKFALLWVLWRTDQDTLIISNDAFPLLVVSVVRKKLMYEMHDFADRSLWMYGMLFARVRWILATNAWKREKLLTNFHIPAEKVLLERNAVDIAQFGGRAREDARSSLGLHEKHIVVYTGHLYEWKGAETLAAAAAFVPEATLFFVGGTVSDVDAFKKKWGSAENIRVIGQVPHEAVPVWQSAADVLVLPNSAKEEISVHYTSPMKLFEYMASERPVVASNLPSIREILPEGVGYFANPDDAHSFAAMIREALNDPEAEVRAGRARESVAEFTWEKRAQRILQATL